MVCDYSHWLMFCMMFKWFLCKMLMSFCHSRQNLYLILQCFDGVCPEWLCTLSEGGGWKEGANLGSIDQYHPQSLSLLSCSLLKAINKKIKKSHSLSIAEHTTNHILAHTDKAAINLLIEKMCKQEYACPNKHLWDWCQLRLISSLSTAHPSVVSVWMKYWIKYSSSLPHWMWHINTVLTVSKTKQQSK